MVLPPASDIHKNHARVDLGLVQKGKNQAHHDVQLLNAMMGQVPTSLKLHAVRDTWDALIRYDLARTRTEAEQLRALASQAPVGTRGWRLLCDEAERLE